MSKYPDDGKLHPTLSDYFREKLDAMIETWKGLSVLVFIVLLLMWYPDWRKILGVWLVLFGTIGVAYHLFGRKK